MATTQVSPDTASATAPACTGRSALDRVILVGLFCAALVYAFINVQRIVTQGAIIPPVLGISVTLLICGAIAATPWRWSMVIPLLLTTVAVVFQLSPGSFPLYAVTHPDDYGTFAPIVLHLGFAIIADVALAVKLAQTIRRQTPHAPRWLNPAVAAFTGLVVGMLLLGGIAQPSSGGGAANANATGTEMVHLTGATFSPNIVALHTGDKLTMIGDAPVPHLIANGTWSGTKPMPGAESGAPAITNVSVDGTTVTVGPFTTPGTYHLYCTVHPGMVLTVIVQ
jgi:plastocyanin